MNIEDDPFGLPADEEAETAPAQEAAPADAEEAPAPEPEVPVEEPVQTDAPTEAPAPTEETPAVAEPAAAPADLVIDTNADEAEHPLEDMPASEYALGAAPPRLHESLVDQLALRWHEVKEFVSRLEGETGMRELDNVLDMARHYLRV